MIYFMQPTDGGPVKIGHTDNLPGRHKQLEAHYGKPLAVLATMDGDRTREAETHARFAHLRLGRTEQFRPAPDLMEFIGRPLLVSPNPDAVEAMPTERLTVFSLKGSPEYRDWLSMVSKKTLVSTAVIARDAIGRWATDRGLPAPPEL